MLGHWDEVWTDINGDGSYASGEKQDRDHNQANEIEDIAGISAPFAYDDAGNMESSGTSTSTASNYFTHDAWNRLTQMKIDTTVQGEYEYNALHRRTVKRARTAPTSTGPDEERLMYYDASWRLLQEDVDNDFDTDPDINERMQTFWGPRYIDDAVYRRIDRGSGDPIEPDGTYEGTFYYVTDAQFSTVAMLMGSNAFAYERIAYTAYGSAARHHWGADVDGDGDIDSNDQSVVTNGATIDGTVSGYLVEADLNRDGITNSSDLAVKNAIFGTGAKAALATGQISNPATGGPDNPIGYDGYVFNAENRLYMVRFRWYEPVLGRWLERDPAGTRPTPIEFTPLAEGSFDLEMHFEYEDGLSLYQYVAAQPSSLVDPSGLELRFATRKDRAFFRDLANSLCPEGNWKIGNPSGSNNRRLKPGSVSFCNPYKQSSGWGCQAKPTITLPRKADTSSRPIICGCLCDAVNSTTVYTLFHETAPPNRQPSPGGYVTLPGWLKVYVGDGRPGGYPGNYVNPSDRPSSVPPGQVQATPDIIFAHELCCHALTQTPHPSQNAYTAADPVIQCENAIRRELGPSYGQRQ